MTDPPSIPYASAAAPQGVDDGYLKAIAICHYVWGGLTMLFSCIFIVHVVMGIAMASGRMNGFPGPSAAPQPIPSSWFGYFFVVFGSIAVLLGWTLGILTIYSGRCIAQRRKWMFSMVVAGINCMWFPVGTTLGVFTFIVLLKPSVKAIYPRITST